ncbi:hypothetical protein C8J56DRAFT_459185 [Mycena floridula]|nr:hypothetical protein C8J56DRAFT_459185 [Mycena floridula]
MVQDRTRAKFLWPCGVSFFLPSPRCLWTFAIRTTWIKIPSFTLEALRSPEAAPQSGAGIMRAVFHRSFSELAYRKSPGGRVCQQSSFYSLLQGIFGPGFLFTALFNGICTFCGGRQVFEPFSSSGFNFVPRAREAVTTACQCLKAGEWV